jgi:hypothetical protein
LKISVAPGDRWGTPDLIRKVCHEVISDPCIVYDELEEVIRRLKDRGIEFNYGGAGGVVTQLRAAHDARHS